MVFLPEAEGEPLHIKQLFSKTLKETQIFDLTDSVKAYITLCVGAKVRPIEEIGKKHTVYDIKSPQLITNANAYYTFLLIDKHVGILSANGLRYLHVAIANPMQI